MAQSVKKRLASLQFLNHDELHALIIRRRRQFQAKLVFERVF
jgi:hypothetical protein